ncbi:nuclear transport factor 2 family protein [Mangrovicoccus sp. HB161399]|uniref:nuclear transport factor 2 family protein n=1 Tax=Mangrovicoccus sp. HB161399 TaxID=2720392 RepID=UPI001554BD17|nr:nuclear transport factor 2 family protein [Mangrovicoccus sp. HB161399]
MGLIDHASPLGQEILGFETRRRAALVSADPAELGKILHDDLCHVHSRGNVHGKAEFIAHVTRMGGFVSIARGALELRQAAGAVLITGPTTNTVKRHGTGEIAVLDGFGSVVSVKTADGWQVLLSQITVTRAG